MSRVIVTGGAGFIGSHLVDKLVENGYEVTVIDNLSSGDVNNLKDSLSSGRVNLVKADLRSWGDWVGEFKGALAVFHLAANPEVRVSSVEPRSHFDNNLVATFNVAEAARLGDVKYIVFASSSTVYGDARVLPTPEDHPMEPISVYGATKAASEVILGTYSRLYGIKVVNLRYANIVGPRSRHGVIYDFYVKLMRNPSVLEVLGDGSQRKSYLYVDDAVDATLFLFNKLINGGLQDQAFNVGNRDWVTVMEIARIVIEEVGLRNVNIVTKPTTPDGRGWPGDVKYMLLDISKLTRLGWSPRYSSAEAVRLTIRWLKRGASLP
jgi:UDP-glucose 4-epimerase